MSTKADCQTACTALEAQLVILQKEEDAKTSHGNDSRVYAVRDIATQVAAVRTQVDALP